MCEAEILAHGIGKVDFILIELLGKSVVVKNRELVHGFLPVPARAVPVGRHVSQGQPDQLDSRIIRWEVAPRLEN